MAASDIFPASVVGGIAVKAAVKGVAKGVGAKTVKAGIEAAKKAALETFVSPNPEKWKATTKWYRDQGFREKGQAAHHWVVEKGTAFGKAHPGLVNQPWNLMPLDAVTHGRLHGPYTVKGNRLPAFNPAEKIRYGTPRWAKGAAVGIPARAGVLTYEYGDGKNRK